MVRNKTIFNYYQTEISSNILEKSSKRRKCSKIRKFQVSNNATY
eukprot:UN11004